MITVLKQTTAAAAIAALSLGAMQAMAESDMATPSGNAGEPPAAGAEAASGALQSGEAVAGDPIIARVGDKEIMRSDVIGVLEALPEEIRQQPEETLVPLAVEQLILREILLEKAQEAGLENDPEVEALVAGAEAGAGDEAALRENAMVQIWLDRALEDAVTEQAVEQTYENVQDQFGDDVPPMAEIRPQLEEEVRRQAFLDLSATLQENADVTLYGPDGEPIE